MTDESKSPEGEPEGAQEVQEGPEEPQEPQEGPEEPQEPQEEAQEEPQEPDEVKPLVDPASLREMTQEERQAFVREYLAGAIYTSLDIHPAHLKSMLATVFLPLGLGGLSGWKKEEIERIGGFWAYTKEAFPRAINGYPMFGSVYIVLKDDWQRVWEAIEREQKRLEDVEV